MKAREFIVVMGLALLLLGAALAQTPSFNARTPVGVVSYGSITEVSGIVASRRMPNVLWVHNDSGDSARVFALNTTGGVHAICSLTGASHRDWEDIALAADPVSGLDYLYLGDIGDNYATRGSVAVYRVPEPMLDTNRFLAVTNLAGVERYVFTYPDGARDAETLLVDPGSGDLYVLSKREANNHIYRAAYPQSTNGTNVLSYEGIMVLGGLVAGDIAPSGRQILVKQYGALYYYACSNGVSVSSALTNAPTAVPYQPEPQGEAVCWQGRERGYYTLSEGASPTQYWYGAEDSDQDGLEDSREVAWQTGMNIPDTDGDGMLDGDEVFAGTQPTNRTDILQWTGGFVETAVLSLEYPAVSGRIYYVERHRGMMSTALSYRAVSTNTYPENGTVTNNLLLDTNAAVYRVRVAWPQDW
jgi:hypothetical protein